MGAVQPDFYSKLTTQLTSKEGTFSVLTNIEFITKKNAILRAVDPDPGV